MPPQSIRAQRLSAAERRSQILREAMRCFASHGYRGTTTRAIAERVGITEAALYRYFPSKQSLYDALIDQKTATPPIQDLVVEAADRRDDPAVFTILARELIERGLGDPDFVRLLFFSALEEHGLSGQFFKARIGSLSSFVTDYIGRRIQEGAFEERDAALASRAFLGMVCDYMNVRVIFTQGETYPQSTEEVVDSFVGIFLAGMRRTQPVVSEPSIR